MQPDQPAKHDTDRRSTRLRWQVRERQAAFVAQILGTPAPSAVPAGRSRRFRVTVLHNTGPWRFHRYLPSDPLVRVFRLAVEATSAEAATEIVFGIANSYPDELHCDPRYADKVAAYRTAAQRSMSAGDVLLIRRWWRTTAWACGPISFDRLFQIPSYQTGR
jgi:hypothetical protein